MTERPTMPPQAALDAALQWAGAKDPKWNMRLVRQLRLYGYGTATHSDDPDDMPILPKPHSEGWGYQGMSVVYVVPWSERGTLPYTGQQWTPLAEEPVYSGTYLLGHAGHFWKATFFAPDCLWMPNTKMGWVETDLANGPTHWRRMEFPQGEAPRFWPTKPEDDFKRRLAPPRRYPLLRKLFGGAAT